MQKEEYKYTLLNNFEMIYSIHIQYINMLGSYLDKCNYAVHKKLSLIYIYTHTCIYLLLISDLVCFH